VSRIGEYILYHLAKRWPSPVSAQKMDLGMDPSSDSYHLNYAQKFQYNLKLKNGIGFDIDGKSVLEIGCGHGGIIVFAGINGAKRAIGIDLNTYHLSIAKRFLDQKIKQIGASALPVEFYEMNAETLALPDNSIDLILADNVFEHFENPQNVMRECFRVLAKGGILSISSVPSIYSRHGLHLKHAIKMPWANIFFSEHTICRVVRKLVDDNPPLKSIYPGVDRNPIRVKDLRAYSDLNGMTYKKLVRIAKTEKFKIIKFTVTPTPKIIGHLIHKLPIIRESVIGDIFSNKASAILLKE
jgi:ubiquinone/menaquinone biosynthesis C-methylase UbiE